MENAYRLLVIVLVIILLPVALAKDYDIRVVDKAENPINNARVVLERDDAECDEETDKDGHAECEGIVSGRDYRIRVTHEDYKSINDDEALEDIPSKADDILVVMRPNLEYDLEVVVVNEDGKGMSKAEVSVRSLEKNLYEDDFDSYDIIVFPDEKSKYTAFEFDEVENTGNDGGATFRGLEFNSTYLVIANKSQYTTVRTEFHFHDKASDDVVEVEIMRSGTAHLTARMVDEWGSPVEGIKVTLESEGTGRNWSGTTDSSGAVTLEVESPGYFDILLNCQGYSCAQPDRVYIANDEFRSITIAISTLNSPPVADAGEDAYVMSGDALKLDGSASYDPDGDALSYFWEDSGGREIGSGDSQEVVFDSPGEQVITLTVEDTGGLSSEDNVTITVEEAKICGDSVCEVGEDDSSSESYCPEDCDAVDDDSSYEAAPKREETPPEEAWPQYLSDLLIWTAAIAILIATSLLFLKRSRRRKTGLRAL